MPHVDLSLSPNPNPNPNPAQDEPHYMRGGKPGYYPSLKEADGIPHPVPLYLFNPSPSPNLSPSPTLNPDPDPDPNPHQVPFDLFNPFGLLPEQSESEKARGRNVEINNGRATATLT